MNVYLAASRRFGAHALRRILQAGHSVVRVTSPADESHPGSLIHQAPLAGIPWSPTLTAAEVPAGTDLIVSAHSHVFVSRKALDRTRLGGIGYHPSLLPLHRGRDAIRWTIHMREPVTGGSVYWLSDSVDAGDIAAQEFCFVRPGWTARELWDEALFPMGLDLVEDVLRDLDNGVIVRIPQDHDLATWEPSWERPPLHRPDLLQLGAAGQQIEGFTVIRDRALAGWPSR